MDRLALLEAVLDEILQERASSRRNRRNPRGVKRKMSSYNLRKKGDPPLPAFDIATVITVIK